MTTTTSIISTSNWTQKDYQNYIIKNRLDEIWYRWCNPSPISYPSSSKSISPIRVCAYTPLYNEENVKVNEKKCEKISCIKAGGKGIYRIPDDSKQRKVLYICICDICMSKRRIMYRWINQRNKTKIYFDSPETVRKYVLKGRSFYGTLTLYNPEIVDSKSMYVDERLMIAHTLGMDIDIKNGTICDSNNREDLGKSIDIIRESLDTFVPNSYSLQTSGNGMYIFLHHLLCTKDIRYTMSQYNGYIKHLQKEIEKQGIKKVKIDAINMTSRVYKIIGSIHQKYDLPCLPIQFDCKINKMTPDDFKLKNFDIKKYLNKDGKLNFYTRFNKNDIPSLYKFLEEQSIEDDSSDVRAYKHIFDSTNSTNSTYITSNNITSTNPTNFSEGAIIASDAISGENQFKELSEKLKEKIREKLKNMTDEEFLSKYVGWKKVNNLNISGRVIYKNFLNDRKKIEMIGVKDEDIDKILYKVWNKINKTEGD